MSPSAHVEEGVLKGLYPSLEAASLKHDGLSSEVEGSQLRMVVGERERGGSVGSTC